MSTTNFNHQEKADICFNNSSVLDKNNGQYSNLNLNETSKSSTASNNNSSNFVHSISNSNSENGRKNIDNTDFNNTLQSKNESTSLNKSILQPIFLNSNDKSEEGKEGQKNLKKTSTENSSTLSLHIAAYENSIEGSTLNSNSDSDKSSTTKTKKTFGKSCKNVKDMMLNGLSSCIQDPFEFPRQQKQEEVTDPEVMQFKASQKLLNPNELNNDESSGGGGGDNAPPTITLEDGDATEKQPQQQNNNDAAAEEGAVVVEKQPHDVIELGDGGGGEEYELEEGEIVDSIREMNIIGEHDDDATSTASTIKTSLEAVADSPITMNEEPQMPHYENITEQMPEDDFVTSLLSQMGQQFRAEQVVQPIRLRIPPSTTMNTTLERVEDHRIFKIGNDKRGKSRARVWIDTPQDDTRVFLYRHSEQDTDETKDVFVCIQCSRHNRVTKFEIRRIENSDDIEVWEQPTHYPSCYRNKAEIEAIQSRYDRKRSMTGILNGSLNGALNGSLNGALNGALNGTLNGSLNGTSNENSFNTSSRSTTLPSRSAGRPKNDYHYLGHRTVPDTDYIFGVNEKGSLKTRILVRDEYNRELGRVYSFHPAKRADGRTIFYCRHCNPKKYVPVTVGDDENGEFTVREAPLERHDASCIPTSFDDLIEKQHQLEEKLQRKGIPMYDYSNINEANMPSRARSPTIAIRSREATQSPSIEEEEPVERRTRSRASRSRSRSPMNASSTSLLNSSGGSARRGRRPDKSLMRIVPNKMWRCDSPNDPGIGSKLLIFTDLDASMGREFVFCEFGLDGGAYYNCQQCLRLTANRQRTKGYVAIESGGQIEVREGKHYPTCRPFVLQNIPPLLPQNQLDDEIPMEGIEDPLNQVVKVNRSPMKPAAATVLVAEEASPSLSPELGAPSSSTRKRDDNEPLPTPSPIQSLNQPSFTDPAAAAVSAILAQTTNFVPQVLTRDKTVFYNVPSSSQMRNASKILGVEYNKDGHVFWNNTLQWISEFRGSSRPAEIRPITMQRFSGFASLAIFVTGNEEYGFEIQRAIKTYFYQNYVTGKNCKLSEDVVLETLISNELTDIHLSIFSRMINCIVGVFDGPLLKVYGSSDYEQSPTMLLRKNDKIFSPVVRIHP